MAHRGYRFLSHGFRTWVQHYLSILSSKGDALWPAVAAASLLYISDYYFEDKNAGLSGWL